MKQLIFIFLLGQWYKGDNSYWRNKKLYWNLLGQYQPIKLREITLNQDKLYCTKNSKKRNFDTWTYFDSFSSLGSCNPVSNIANTPHVAVVKKEK